MRLDLPARLSARYGSRVALSDLTSGTSLSFAELDQRAHLAAERLREQGIRPGDRISLLSGPDMAAVVLFFGAVRVGASLVPHNLRLSTTELAEELGRVHPALLVHGRGAPAELPVGGWRGGPPVSLGALTGPGATSPSAPGEPPDWESPALVLFTGGSTGRPKGAVLSLRELFSNALTTVEGWQLRPEDSTILVFPMFHTGGWNVLLLPLLIAGGRSIFMERFDPVELLRRIDEEKVTILGGVPSMFIDLVGRPEFARASLSSLRFAKSGGGSSPDAVVNAFRQRGIPFYQGYGLTEAGPNLLYSTPDDLDRPGTIGRPNLLADMKLVDEHGREGDVGELLVSGPLLFSGYLDDPAASAAAMSGPYVRTGDVLRRDADGFYYFVGRTKLMFKSGGENVFFAEVEQALESHPAVAEAAVIGIPDLRWGEVGCAFVRRTRPVTEEEIVAFLRDRLAHFKVPRRFVWREEIPRTPAGKKDYPRLRREVGP
ncbi:MAG: class I adenylate-forming enzyme family protein [Thermoplasmata archaeon]